eukprot:TRINITY_DN30157_c0_g1_i1.p1 TRINITY_DN30157_c0_g1~~TRINITY_DN30157_c0_g1_i1.p1  ORF type:complete len:181 (+),score=24.06 TRINITY_DN30157_c0_g1_i1:55-543(+)
MAIRGVCEQVLVGLTRLLMVLSISSSGRSVLVVASASVAGGPVGTAALNEYDWPDDNGYRCDVSMRDCAAECEPPFDMDQFPPDMTGCNTWKCLMHCAKSNEEFGCLPPWRDVCNDFAREMPPTGAGAQCDVDCSVATRCLGFRGIIRWATAAVFVHALLFT